jgi:hypothetical protein
MQVGSIELAAFQGGPLSGSLVLTVLPGSQDVKPTKLVTLLDQAITQYGVKARVAEMGRGPDDFLDADPKQMANVVQALRDRGFSVIGHLGADEIPQWSSFFDYRIAHLTKAEWLGYHCNEIWFSLEDTLAEPDIPQNMNPVLVLEVKPGVNFKDVYFFVKEAKRPWRIKWAKEYRLKIWEAE